MTLNNHAECIAYQYHVHTGLIHELRETRIVGSHASDLLAARFHFGERGQSNRWPRRVPFFKLSVNHRDSHGE
jgi:hypothetical protein